MKSIGDYRIIGLLGRGMMAKVYLVSLPVIGKTAALKRLMPDPLLADLIGKDRVRDQFIREAITMAGMRNPYIVDVSAYEEIDGTPCYLMEYYCHDLGTLIGETYRTEQPSRIIRIDRAVEIILDTLGGLARLHHAGIVHRDIKPFNIMLTDQGRVKIGDFGLSRLRGEIRNHPANLKVGSPYYAAPEQEAHPDSVDARADLYSAGVMLYRMLTGRLPDERMVPASCLNPDINEQWDVFMDKALATAPEGRFRTARGMRRELAALYDVWREERDSRCSLPRDMGTRVDPTSESTLPLRDRPVRAAPRTAPDLFGTNVLWRPEHPFRSRLQANENGTVTDAATGLIWQQSGTPYPVRWQEALDHVEGLNRLQFAGRTLWRLPTVNELLSILNPTPHREDFCAESVFDTVQKWVWSADRRSFKAAYYVNFEMGFVAWHDMSGYFYAKGVCTDTG